MGNFIVWLVWIGAAFVCLASAVAVISFTNPFFSALALIGNLASLAVFFLLLSAEFVAAAQVLVYAGAVMVMFLFVIAYLGGEEAEAPWAGGPTWQSFGAAAAAGAILVEVIVVIGLRAGGRLSNEAEIARAFGSPEEIGRFFLTDHLLAFEITSIVLLIAAVGGVILGGEARRDDLRGGTASARSRDTPPGLEPEPSQLGPAGTVPAGMASRTGPEA